MIKSLILASASSLVSAFLLVTVVTSASADSSFGSESERVYTVSAILQPVAAVSAGDVSTQGLGSIPPGGGCRWEVTLRVRGTFVDKVLTDTAAEYGGNITCQTTGSNQTMDELGLTAEVLRNNNIQKRTDHESCFNEWLGDPLCLNLSTSDTSYCSTITGSACHGSYRAAVTMNLLLPAGYYYATLPAGCTSLGGGREAYCITYTGAVNVPAVL